MNELIQIQNKIRERVQKHEVDEKAYKEELSILANSAGRLWVEMGEKSKCNK
jgi:hypothetical protein